MSLFNSVDTTLPAITQVMQIDTKDNEEVLAFWRRCIALAHYAAFMDNPNKKEGRITVDKDGYGVDEQGEVYIPLDPNSVVQMISANLATTDRAFHLRYSADLAKERGHESAEIYLLKQFRVACIFTRRILTSIHDNGTVPLKDLHALRASFRSPAEMVPDPMEFYEVIHNPSAEPERTFMPFIEFLPPGMMGKTLPAYFLVRELEDALIRLWHKRSYLNVCKECENLFLAQRPETRYCSRRCTDRAGTRKRRHKKKQESNVVVA